MAKTFREWDPDQAWLLPPSVHQLVPKGHMAHFVRNMVREDLDLTAIEAAYEEERGHPPYHPGMMTALLLYAYSQGVFSSRRIARGCEERVDFMAVTAQQRPDFRTISDFRKRHLEPLAGLFLQVLQLCQKAGLVQLGHVALDGTKMKANASRHKAMSYGRMKETQQKLAGEVRDWFAAAGRADADEDRRYGRERRGDELPEWVANRQQRLEKIRAAKAALEAGAHREVRRSNESSPPPPAAVRQLPEEKAQRNFTDPDSRIMKGSDGFVQAYNGQIAVDGAHQVIVAAAVTQATNDQKELVPMVATIRHNTGRKVAELSADAGYCSEENLKELHRRRIRGYVATGRQKHGATTATGADRQRGRRVRAMALRLKRAGRRSRYRLRKVIVEPVFGQIKQAMGFRQFLLRGFQKVSGEWSLVCTALNLRKLAKVAV